MPSTPARSPRANRWTRSRQPKIRLAKTNAEKAEPPNAKARSELIPAVEVEREWAAVLRSVRAAMLALPSRVAQRLGHPSPHDVAEIDREVRDALRKSPMTDALTLTRSRALKALTPLPRLALSESI